MVLLLIAANGDSSIHISAILDHVLLTKIVQFLVRFMSTLV